MIYQLYAVKDKFTGFLAPSPNMNDDAAKRDFSYAVNNNPGVMNFSPDDYDLYNIGTYDSHSGEIKQPKSIRFICNGREVINEK